MHLFTTSNVVSLYLDHDLAVYSIWMHFVDFCSGDEDQQPSAPTNRYTHHSRLRVFVALASHQQQFDFISPPTKEIQILGDQALITPARYLFPGSEEDDFGPSPTTIIDVENSYNFSRYRSQKESLVGGEISNLPDETSIERVNKSKLEHDFELMKLFVRR